MPPIIPIGSINAIKPIDAMGTGMPAMRGPQGETNKGDAGFSPVGFKVPQVNIPALNPQKPQMLQNAPQDAVLPEDKPPVDHPMSVNGWLKNLSEDIYQFAAAIPASFKIAAQSGAEIAKNWRYLDDIFINNPELIAKELDTTTRQVIKGLTDTYEGGLGKALYKHPFSVLLDATGVFDLAGIGIKAVAKGAVKAGLPAAKAAQLTKLGASIQTMPGRIMKAPFTKSLAMLEKVPQAQKLMQAFALDDLGRQEARRLGGFQLEEKALMEPHAKALFKSRISKADWEHFDDALDFLPDSQIRNPAILERKREWMAGVMEDERKWMELGIKTPEELEKAVLKQTALKLKSRGKFKGELYTYGVDERTGERVINGFTDEAYDAAKRWNSGENPWNEPVRPVYKQFIHERSFGVEDLLNALGAGENSETFRKYVSRFEQKTGKSPVIMNPDVWQARSLLQKGELMGTLKYWQDSIQRLGKPLKAGGKADDGYVIAPPFLSKYVERGLPDALDLLTQKATEALDAAKRAGGDRAVALKEAMTAARAELINKVNDILPDLRAAQANPADYMVQIPKQVAYLMEKSMFGPRGAWKFYDNVLNTWRDMILTFMPRYYVNNLLGNAVMLMFAGHTPFNKVSALKQGDLTGEALNSSLASESGASSSYLAQIAPNLQVPVRRFLGMMAEASDSRAKQLALGTLSKEIIARDAELGNAVASALQAAETAEDAAAILFRARREVMGSGLRELIQSRRAMRAGELDEMFKPNVRIDPVKQSIADGLKRDIQQLENRIQFEKNLTSVVPDTSPRRGGSAVINSRENLFPKNINPEVGRLKAELKAAQSKERRIKREFEEFERNPEAEFAGADSEMGETGWIGGNDTLGDVPTSETLRLEFQRELDEVSREVAAAQAAYDKAISSRSSGPPKEKAASFGVERGGAADASYKTVSRVDELKAQLKMKADQLSKIDPEITITEFVGPQIEKMPELAKLAELQLRRKALQPYADLAEKTVLQMEKFFGNYGRLHPLEREYIRRVIPFWTFSKTMFQLAFNLPFLRPKTSFLWHQFSKLMVDAIGDDRLPNRYRNMVPIGGDEEGNIVFLKIGGFNPFEQASQLSSIGGVTIPKVLDPRNNPLVKIGVESIGGYDLFTEKPFVKTTDFVSLNGSVKRYDPDLQRIETVIPQKPIIDSLFQQLPHMRVLAELVQSAGLSSDYLGVETPRNPDGTLTYNRQWWHALMRAGGFPISTQNPEKVKMQHELLKKGMIKRFRSASGRVDPTTRMQLESILRDLDRAEVYE